MFSYTMMLLLLFAVTNAAPRDPTSAELKEPTVRSRFPCPCVCRSGPMRVESTRKQCTRPRFMGRCVQSMCKQDNPRMSPGFWCCDPTSSPTPSASPSPVLCPCTCRTGPRREFAANQECDDPMTASRCVVRSCRRGLLRGMQCCDPHPTPSPKPCPCFCRTGSRAEMSATQECSFKSLSSTCKVEACTRRGDAKGFQCCDI